MIMIMISSCAALSHLEYRLKQKRTSISNFAAIPCFTCSDRIDCGVGGPKDRTERRMKEMIL
jgi:hypothetical protein